MGKPHDNVKWGNNIVLPPCAGIVLAEELVTTPLPAIQEFSTSKILSGTSAPTNSKYSSTAVTTGRTTAKSTTEPPTTPHNTTTKSTTEPPTTPHNTTTKSTTEPPTTPHNTTTKSTTEPPTTPHNTTTKSTTEPPTTPHNTTTKSTTEPPTTPHNTTTKSTTEPPTTMHHNITNSTTEAPTTAHSNATTAPTPPPTSPPVPNPTVGNYSVKSDNVTVCLLAKMGLQFSFKMSEVGTKCLCRRTKKIKKWYFNGNLLLKAITPLQVFLFLFRIPAFRLLILIQVLM